MEDEIGVPVKTLFQICVVNKQTDEIIYDNKVIAYDEHEAISKAKLGTIITDLGYADGDVEVLYRAIAYLSSGANKLLEDKPTLTSDEQVSETNRRRDLSAELDELKGEVTKLKVSRI